MKQFLMVFGKFTNTLNGIAKVVSGLMFFGMIFCGCWQVFSRYVFKVSAPWCEEAARFLFVWTTILGCSCVSKAAKHIEINALIGHLHGMSKSIIANVVSVILIWFYAVIVHYGLINTIEGFTHVSSVQHLPMAYVYVCIPISFTLMIIYEIEFILQRLVKVKEDTDDTVEIGGAE